MNIDDLSTACPGIDFSIPCKPYDRNFTIGNYVIKHLQKTFNIIKSSPCMENSMIWGFVEAGIKDHHLPYTEEYLIRNLKCSSTEAIDFLLIQSSHFAVSFEPQEYKRLGPLDFTPFVLDTHTKPRAGDYGIVKKVFEGNKPFARKIISDSYDLEKRMMELKILEMATATRNPHLLHLRCAYQQENHTHLIMHPWCDLDLSTFINSADKVPWWTQRAPKERLILITDWMACLASGLSALHKKNIKHQDMKPENILLDDDLLPVICNFGLSKVFNNNSKSVKIQGTLVYMPPEQCHGKVGRKGDIFSLGLVFVELALLYFGRKRWKDEFTSGYYADGTENLFKFLQRSFPLAGDRILDDWINHFQELMKIMLDVVPENRPRASAVWETLKGVVESLGAKPHCEAVSPVGSNTHDFDETEDDTELQLRENWSKLVI